MSGRISSSVALVAVFASLAGAQAAVAAESYTCDLTAARGTLSPAVPNVQSELEDAPSDLVVDRENGTVDFFGGLVCTVVEGTTVRTDVPGSIRGTGTYANRVCSIGSATGGAQIDIDGAARSPVVAKFVIELVAGSGAIRLTALRDAQGRPGLSGGGYIRAAATDDPAAGHVACVTDDVTGFDLEGSINVTFGP